MVRAWYMDDKDDDQRLPHQTDPLQLVSLDDLKAQCGVLYFQIDADKFEKDGSEEKFDKIRKERGYSYEDRCVIDDKMADYDATLKKFFTEHIHSDEEIRFIVDGSGYFDIRDPSDRWIRVEVVKNDLLIVPAGIYHRFTLDTKNYIIARRYFAGEPVWTPHNRPCEDHPSRKSYVSQYIKA
eukprot:GHVU01161159.1.p1 GENE.GHVU01161159.1~~GHVU01161159.1.p1  ORF type:complete len:182 (-),score=32.90 GHVU01161159.1:675-1220(-)